jgi:hypothetical protein
VTFVSTIQGCAEVWRSPQPTHRRQPKTPAPVGQKYNAVPNINTVYVVKAPFGSARYEGKLGVFSSISISDTGSVFDRPGSYRCSIYRTMRL